MSRFEFQGCFPHWVRPARFLMFLGEPATETLASRVVREVPLTQKTKPAETQVGLATCFRYNDPEGETEMSTLKRVLALSSLVIVVGFTNSEVAFAQG